MGVEFSPLSGRLQLRVLLSFLRVGACVRACANKTFKKRKEDVGNRRAEKKYMQYIKYADLSIYVYQMLVSFLS